MSFANRNSFTSAFLISMPFISSSCFTALARTSRTMLKKSGESRHPFLIPDLRRKVLSFTISVFSFLSSYRLLKLFLEFHFYLSMVFFKIEAQLIYNIVLVSNVQQSDSVIHIYMVCTYWCFCFLWASPSPSPASIRQKENSGYLPPCHSLGPKVPIWSAFFSPPYRVYLCLFSRECAECLSYT